LLFHYKDARVHCAVLKKRAGPGHHPLRGRISWSARRRCQGNRPFRTQQRAWVSSCGLRGSTPPANRRLY
jgi:hypothetical protein